MTLEGNAAPYTISKLPLTWGKAIGILQTGVRAVRFCKGKVPEKTRGQLDSNYVERFAYARATELKKKATRSWLLIRSKMTCHHKSNIRDVYGGSNALL